MTTGTEPTDAETSEHQRFERVVVALGSPDNAPFLIELGMLVASHDGELSLVTIVTGDAEAESSAEEIQALREVVASAREKEFELELDARTAPAVARGILDFVQERRADLVVLGTPDAESGLGAIDESVMEAVGCTAIAVRPGRGDVHEGRVIVGVDGSELSRELARLGILLGAGLGVDVEAIHVRDQGYSTAFGRSQLATSLDGVKGAESVRRSVVDSAVVGYGLGARSKPSDLVIIGETPTSRLGTFMSRDTTKTLLANSRATVLVVSPSMSDDRSIVTRALGRIRALRPQLTRLERDSVVWSTSADAPLTTDFVILLAVSALLASLGLLQNSAAVVIGAMLVAPLLGPLAAASIGLVTARLRLTARSLVTLVVGTFATIVVALLAGLAIPIDAPTSEMLARGSPSLVDLGVAIAAGVVGAYATARKDIPAALAGVAIAAALVPPICTTGLALAFGDTQLAIGSFLLFATNIVSVVISGGAVLWWMGMRPTEKTGRAGWGAAIIVVALAFVLVVFGLNSFQDARDAQLAADDLADLFPTGEVIDVASRSRSPMTVVATVRMPEELTAADVSRIETQLEDRLGQDIILEVVIERVVVSGG